MVGIEGIVEGNEGSGLAGNGGRVVGTVGNVDFGKDGIWGREVGNGGRVVGRVGNWVEGNGGNVAGFGKVGAVGSVGNGVEGSGGNVVLGRVGAVGSVGKVFEGLGSVGSEGKGGS
ncbi:glycine, alanine and asparagine-rich protein [Prunus persica]|uniref:glycine, alanine and asparagine-rich protein n=1 Tax=Prunus persica TaxID=3760 RepID=UPI0009AB290E|nr:glycine, alanine and asparagine-rich protein [Prunus persica]